MSVFDDFTKEAEAAIDSARSAIMDVADSLNLGGTTQKPAHKLVMMKNHMDWREQFLLTDGGRNIVYVGLPEKKTRSVRINSRVNKAAADVLFSKKRVFKDGLGVSIHVYQPEFSFDIDFDNKGILFSIEDFSIISLKNNHFFVKDGDVDAIDVYKRLGSFEATYCDPKYEYLAAALLVALYVNKKW